MEELVKMLKNKYPNFDWSVQLNENNVYEVQKNEEFLTMLDTNPESVQKLLDEGKKEVVDEIVLSDLSKIDKIMEIEEPVEDEEND